MIHSICLFIQFDVIAGFAAPNIQDVLHSCLKRYQFTNRWICSTKCQWPANELITTCIQYTADSRQEARCKGAQGKQQDNEQIHQIGYVWYLIICLGYKRWHCCALPFFCVWQLGRFCWWSLRMHRPFFADVNDLLHWTLNRKIIQRDEFVLLI